jgi:hypothetical protein
VIGDGIDGTGMLVSVGVGDEVKAGVVIVTVSVGEIIVTKLTGIQRPLELPE